MGYQFLEAFLVFTVLPNQPGTFEGALHGVLHCTGFDDRDAAGAAAMHAEEDRILGAIGVGATFGRGAGGAPGRADGRAPS